MCVIGGLERGTCVECTQCKWADVLNSTASLATLNLPPEREWLSWLCLRPRLLGNSHSMYRRAVWQFLNTKHDVTWGWRWLGGPGTLPQVSGGEHEHRARNRRAVHVAHAHAHGGAAGSAAG